MPTTWFFKELGPSPDVARYCNMQQCSAHRTSLRTSAKHTSLGGSSSLFFRFPGGKGAFDENGSSSCKKKNSDLFFQPDLVIGSCFAFSWSPPSFFSHVLGSPEKQTNPGCFQAPHQAVVDIA